MRRRYAEGTPHAGQASAQHEEQHRLAEARLTETKRKADQDLKVMHDTTEERFKHICTLLKIIVQECKSRGENVGVLQQWYHKYEQLIVNTSMSRLITELFEVRVESIRKFIGQGQWVTEREALTAFSFKTKDVLDPKVWFSGKLWTTSGAIWREELVFNLFDAYRGRNADDKSAPKAVTPETVDLTDPCYRYVNTVIDKVLPTQSDCVKVSREYWFKLYREVRVLKHLLCSHEPIVDDKGSLLPIFKVDAVMERVQSWNPPRHLVEYDPREKPEEHSLNKFRPIGRREAFI